jgi:hypothetical protein
MRKNQGKQPLDYPRKKITHRHEFSQEIIPPSLSWGGGYNSIISKNKTGVTKLISEIMFFFVLREGHNQVLDGTATL